MKGTVFLLAAIFFFGLALRIFSVYPANIIVGFDQARDLSDSRKIVLERDLRIVGPTAGNNPSLHHGVAFLYFILPPLLLAGGNPFWVIFWNSLFNAGVSLILFFFAKSLFQSDRAGIFAGSISAVSYYFIQFSGWIGNPTVTLVTVPLFYFGLWQYKQGKNWGLPLSSFTLGISLQFELFFLYLIPIGLISWFILRPKIPSLKETLASLVLFALATSTMILTEIKFGFSGASALLSDLFGKGAQKPDFVLVAKEFLDRFWATFSLTLWPAKPSFGPIIGIILTFFVILRFIDRLIDKKEKRGIKLGLRYLLLYLFSPAIMLLIGYHKAPWFLIGLPPAIALAAGYVLAKIKPAYLSFLLLALLGLANLKALQGSLGRGQILLEPDASAILSSQLAAIDYTYQKSQGIPFAINTVTNPLYINAVWAYNYDWYGKNYGYLPTWLGGDQLPPYNTLGKPTGEEKYFYLIVDETPRIPYVHKLAALKWAEEKGKLIEEKRFGGILVQMRRPGVF